MRTVGELASVLAVAGVTGAVLALLAMAALIAAAARHAFRAADAAASVWLAGLLLSIASITDGAGPLLIAIGSGLIGVVVTWSLPAVRRPRLRRSESAGDPARR